MRTTETVPRHRRNRYVPSEFLSPTATHIKAEGAVSKANGTLGNRESGLPSLKATHNSIPAITLVYLNFVPLA